MRHRYKNPGSGPRHIKESERETPESLYVAIKFHLQTGSASLLQTMHRGGLCVSFDRLRTFSTDVTNSIIMHWEQISVAVPHQDNKGVLLQVGSIISITTHHRPQQHLPSMEHTYAFNSIFRLNTSKVKKIHKILDPVERDKKHVKYLPACYRTMDLDITLSHDSLSFLHSSSQYRSFISSSPTCHQN